MRLFLLILIVFHSLILLGQESENVFPDRVATNMATQLAVFRQEKIYLHTDRSTYQAGDRIWFKAYLRDASDVRRIPASRYVYVELIAQRDSLVSRVKVRPENDSHHGYLEIPFDLKAGNYTLCAYTKAMANVGQDYFFKKSLQIGHVSSSVEEQKASVDYQVAVFPEGGYLLEGKLCRVAFKAMNEQGWGEEILYAELTDHEGTVVKDHIRSFHLGMGSFSFIPEKGKNYTLNCRNVAGIWKQVVLPAAQTTACGLVVNWRNDEKLAVRVLKGAESQGSSLYLVIHKGGSLLYAEQWKPSTPYMIFSKELLPQGVLNLLLLDETGRVLSERLAFCRKTSENPQLHFTSGRDFYPTREKVTASLSVRDVDGNPLSGHLSVAVTDDNAITPDSTISIQSTFLLTSELKGYVEYPDYYFNHPSAQTDEALDQLMMIQGWRRYDIPKVIKGIIDYPEIKPEIQPSLSGKVVGLVSSKGLKGSRISILSPKETWYALLETDDQGYFYYNDYEYADSTLFYLQAYTQKGTDRLRLKVDRDTFPVMKALKNRLDFSSHPANRNYRYDTHGMHIIDLPEVIATAVRREKRLTPYSISATDIIDQEEIKRYRQPNLRMALAYMTGKGIQRIEGNNIILTGNADRKGPALVMLDGVIVEDLDLEMILAENVEQIEIIAPYKGAIFGSRGEYGAVNIVSRYEGFDAERLDMTILAPLGYQRPVEFYSPQYETGIQRKQPEMDYRSTLYWQPVLTPDEEGIASFDFYTSDAFPTTYSVVIEGITGSGQLVRKTGTIKIGK